MKKTHYSFFILMCAMLATCKESTYSILAPKPTLELTLLQDTYTVGTPVYIQLSATQQGYSGVYELSVIQNTGTCDLTVDGTTIPLSGEWVKLSTPTAIMVLTPRQIGALRLSFEVRTANSSSSGRSTLNLTITLGDKLSLDVKGPQSASIATPIQIVITASKQGFGGVIPVVFNPIAGEGVLQFGALTIPAAGSFSIPANSTQTLYYSPAARGIHKLQFSASDSYTTDFKSIEIIITE